MVNLMEVRVYIRQMVDHMDVGVYKQQMVGPWRLELSMTVEVVVVLLNDDN